MQKKTYSPFRCKFSKAEPADQLKVLRKLTGKDTSLLNIINELFRIDPVISVRSDGRVNFLTDRHLFI
jgi:NAD kinase